MVKHKFVNDLGVAAYILMHGYIVIGKKERSIYFECSTPQEESEFDDLVLEYQPPNEFYTFDSCLMFLKKMNEFTPRPVENQKTVSDLGVAAFLLANEYKDTRLGLKVIGKNGRYVHFCLPEEKNEAFDRLSYAYLPSRFHSYDSNLVALKKIGEYMPSN